MHLGNGRRTHRDTFSILLISFIILIWIVPIFTVLFHVILFLLLLLSVYGRKVVLHWFMIMRFQIEFRKGISVISIVSMAYKKFIIYTDILSAVESLQEKNLPIQKHQAFLQPTQKLPSQIQIIIHVASIPCHVGIIGNETAGGVAIEHGSTFMCFLVEPQI